MIPRIIIKRLHSKREALSTWDNKEKSKNRRLYEKQAQIQ